MKTYRSIISIILILVITFIAGCKSSDTSSNQSTNVSPPPVVDDSRANIIADMQAHPWNYLWLYNMKDIVIVNDNVSYVEYGPGRYYMWKHLPATEPSVPFTDYIDTANLEKMSKAVVAPFGVWIILKDGELWEDNDISNEVNLELIDYYTYEIEPLV